MVNAKLPLGTAPTDWAEAYSLLRKVVGLVAITLPFVLVLGDAILDRIDEDPGKSEMPLGSISSYFYEHTQGWFVGSLFALAVFFLSYEYKPEIGRSADNLMSTFASVLAVGVALFPTPPSQSEKSDVTVMIGVVHFTCAGALFMLLALFSLYQFTKTKDEVTPQTSWADRCKRLWRTAPEFKEKMSAEKISRNKVFRTCGWVMVAGLVAVVVDNLADLEELLGFDPHFFFWGEAVAIVAFGVSWLVKGGFLGFLADAPKPSGGHGAFKAVKAPISTARRVARP